MYMAGQHYRAGDVVQTVELLSRHQPAPGDDDLRGLAWHYLWAMTTHDTFAQAQVKSEVYQVALSPDGNRLAAVSMDHKLYLYLVDSQSLKSQSLKRQATIEVGPNEVNGVAWSPDGELLATADDDGMIRLWNSHSHAPVRHWKAHEAKAYNVVFFDGGKKLASCGEENTIRLWNAATGEPDGVLEGHTEPVEALALSPVENLLASAGEDDVAITWDLTTRKLKNRLIGHKDKLTSLAFSPDGKWLATGGQDCTSACIGMPTRSPATRAGFPMMACRPWPSRATAGSWRAIAPVRYSSTAWDLNSPREPRKMRSNTPRISGSHIPDACGR